MSNMRFQVERIALFSDAVFAIAITLMIIEVKAPHIPHGASWADALAEVLKLFPSFIGIILSFFLIGVFWIRHHQLMKYMTAYNSKLLRLNLSFLLCIIFIPFSTALVFHNMDSHSPVPLIFYNLNYIAASLLNYRLFNYILEPANGLCAENIEEDRAQIKKEILFPILVYVLVMVLAVFSPPFAAMGYSAFALENLLTRKKAAS